MSTREWPKIDTAEDGKLCPRCGRRGSGPYRRRVGRNQIGLYFKHDRTDSGRRRIVWHYVPTSKTAKRREELLRLIDKEGWNGFWYYSDRLNISERTIRRYVAQLRYMRMLIHRPHGGYIADPTGKLLREYPQLAW